MATGEWTGGAFDGLYDTGDNWVGGSALAAGTSNILIMGKRAVYPMHTGPASGTAINGAYVSEACPVAMGMTVAGVAQAITNLTVNAGTNPTFQWAGSGPACYFNGTCTNFEVLRGNRVVYSGGTPTAVRVSGGDVVLGASLVLGSAVVYCAGGLVQVEKDSTNRLGTLLVTGGGKATIKKHTDVIYVGEVAGRAGELIAVDDVNVNSGTKTIHQTGGIIRWQSSGTIDTLNGAGGLFLTDGNPNQTFTITQGYTLQQAHMLKEMWRSGAVTLGASFRKFAGGVGGPFAGLGLVSGTV